MDPKSFYSKKIIHHKFLRDAVLESLADENIKTADIVITGIPEGGIGSDEEDVNDDLLEPSGIPDDIAAEVDTMIPVDDDEETEDIEETERRDKPCWMKKNIERKEMESERGKEREYASKKLSEFSSAIFFK
ncbi:uncharacterized protein LOC135220178 [Macrobrachium nipponense]|uniref:uncharacterized protein LOC135220178 n=1 Tax=Macrobrachium nipponense TaxID=159736 RepID=UPI0030C88021